MQQITPQSAHVGAVVRVYGTGFSATQSQDTVKFNGTAATVSSALPGELIVTVPAGASTGAVKVVAPGGSASSTTPFTVAAVNAPTISSVSTSLAMAGSTFTVTGTNFDTTSTNDGLVVNDTRALVTGATSTSLTATVPASAGSGQVQVATAHGLASGPDLFIPPPGVSLSSVVVGGRLTPGTPVTATLTQSGQVDMLLAQGTASGQLVLSITNSSMTGGSIEVFSPDDVEVVDTAWTSQLLIGTATTGSYTIVLAPATVGSATLTTTSIPPWADSQVVPSATGASVTTSTVGYQGAGINFEGLAGSRVVVSVPSDTYPGAPWSILYAPDGSVVWAGWVSALPAEMTLPETGTYTFAYGPQNAQQDTWSGSLTWDFYTVPPNVSAAVTPTVSGASVAMPSTVIGQGGEITFQGTPGEQLVIAASSDTYANSPWSILYAPNGAVVAASWLSDLSIEVELPQSGTYTLGYAEQSGAAQLDTGSASFTFYAPGPDPTATVTPTAAGATVAMPATTVGQAGVITLQGTPGEQVVIAAPSDTYASSPWSILYAPNGAVVGASWLSGLPIEVTLPQSGTYTFAYSEQPGPALLDTGSASFTFYTPGAYPSETVTPTSAGAAVAMPATAVGQAGSVTFQGTAGGSISIAVSNDTYSSSPWSILYAPDGTVVWSGWLNSGGPSNVAVSETGTYTFAYAQQSGQALLSTGSVTLTFTSGANGDAIRRPSSSIADLGGSVTAVTPHAPSSHPPVAHRFRAPKHPIEPGVSLSATPSVARRSKHQAHAGASRRARPLVAFSTRAPASWTPTRRNFRGDWRTHRVPSPWASLAPLASFPASTSLAGQALLLNGKPAVGVRVSVQGFAQVARTDSSGRFVLNGLAVGHRVAVVNGGGKYGNYEIGVDLTSRHQETILPFTIWMEPLDLRHAVSLGDVTKKEITLTTPHIPGLEVRIPAGSTITTANGKPVKRLSITAVPTDRPPFPLPMGTYFPVYVSVQPAGAYLSRGAEIIYPNYSHLPAGQRVPFWNYSPGPRGWYIYGEGTVSASGKQIVPDPGVRVWQFTGAMISGSLLPPSLKNFIAGLVGADPVNLGSGLFTYQKTDLQEPDSVPVAVTRVYRPADSNSYAFGIGMNDSYDMRLFSQGGGNYNSAELIMPDGTDIHYQCTACNDGYYDAVDEATNTASQFYGSFLRWNPSYLAGGGWEIRMRNGTRYEFAPEVNYGLVGIIDRAGNAVTITRDASGNILQVTSPNGRWITFQHDSDNRITQATDNSGRVINYAYNTAGQLASVTDANNPAGTIHYTYSPSTGWMTGVTNARATNLITNTYDANGRVLTQTMGNETSPYTFSYVLNGSGLVTQSTETDPDGNETVSNMDANGNPLSVTQAAGTPLAETTTDTYQPGTNLLLTSTDQLQRETAFTYDNLGNVSSTTQMAGTSQARTTSAIYDIEYSEPISSTDAAGHTTNYYYDSAGDLTSTTDPAGQTTWYRYANDDGRVTSVTDPDGNATAYGYQLGDPYSVTDPDGNTTTSYLDAAGRDVADTNALGQTTLKTYDPLNDLTSITDPDGHMTKYTYDADGDLLTMVDPNNNTTTYTYDYEDRLATKKDALSGLWTYGYDNDSDLTSVQDAKGQTTVYTFDALGRNSLTTYKTSAGATQSTINYTYDLGNRLTQAVDSTGGTFTETPDSFDETTQESGPNGTISYTYNPDGTRATSQVTGQPQLAYAYSPDASPTSITGGGQTVGLAYDAAQRLTATTLPDGITEAYTNDPDGNVTDILYDNSSLQQIGDLHYQYDPLGDPTAQWGSYARATIPAAWGTATYNADNELTANGKTAYTYDANGSLTSDGTNTYAWNARNQLTNLTAKKTSSSYTYDPFGRRESSTLSGTTTNYLDDGDSVVQSLTGSTPTANYIPAYSSTTSAAGTQSYLTDALGSVLALASSTDTTPTTYTYDPFGAQTTSGTASPNPNQYTGLQNDGNGLQYNNARYYDASLERFISQDPAGPAGSGTNLYQYANDNPTGETDPSGLSAGGFLGAGGCIAQALGGGKDLTGDLGCGISLLAMTFADPEGEIGIEALDLIDGEGIATEEVTAADLTDTTAQGLRDLAGERGYEPFGQQDADGLYRKFRYPGTKQQALRIDQGHVDPDTGLPYDNPNAAVPHGHGYDFSGAPVRDPETGDPHFPFQ